jgi:rhodanese-related sulfurtransferase
MPLDRLLAFAELHLVPVLALAALTVAILWTEITRRLTGYQRLTPASLTSLINREDALVVDVSAAADFDKGRIAGSKNLPLAQFDPEHKLLGKAKERPVAVVCRTGMGSADAAKRLLKAGYTRVHWLEGGTAAWQQAELPLVKGKG